MHVSPLPRIAFAFSQLSPHSSRSLHNLITTKRLSRSNDKLSLAKYRNGTLESPELSIWHWNAHWNVASGFSTDPLLSGYLRATAFGVRIHCSKVDSRPSPVYQRRVQTAHTDEVRFRQIRDKLPEKEAKGTNGCTSCMPLSLRAKASTPYFHGRFRVSGTRIAC